MTDRSITAVHGFNFSLNDPAAVALYAAWSVMAQQRVDGFPWYSGRLSIDGELIALKDGEPDPYIDAYQNLAAAAAQRLAEHVAGLDSPIGMSHSLGTRTTLLAVRAGAKFSRLVMFNGAMLQRDCACIELPPTLNLVCRSDAVLNDLGSRFGGEVGACIGSAGLPGAANIVVDDPVMQERVLNRRGWLLGGKTHDGVYSFKGNWPMVRAFLAGDDLADLPVEEPQKVAA